MLEIQKEQSMLLEEQMMKLKEKATRFVVRQIERQMKRERFGWPPECCGAFYQPRRPAKKTNEAVHIVPINIKDCCGQAFL